MDKGGQPYRGRGYRAAVTAWGLQKTWPGLELLLLLKFRAQL